MAIQKIGIGRARYVEDVSRHHAHLRPHPAVFTRQRIIISPGVLVVVEVAFALLELVEDRVRRHVAEFAQHHDIFAVGLHRIGTCGIDHDRAIVARLFLKAAVRMPPVSSRLPHGKFGGEGLTRLDPGEAHSRNAIELKWYEKPVPVNGRIFLKLVMHV